MAFGDQVLGDLVLALHPARVNRRVVAQAVVVATGLW
jgi:hypothetical protein